jgi:DNA mismatch repair protein MutL
MSEVIRLLPDHIANQIAAGEVIQRPASVVKELVENAIDAGATEIEIFIKDAGKTLIQVLDDGSGMSEMDARMAFERHATSKLRTAADLFNLSTNGFRGEALASIAAISHVELKSKMDNQEWGTSVVIEGSKLVDQSPVTCKVGTSFEIKNLFFNVPARRNFLKSDGVEFKHIEDEFIRIALANPDTMMSLHHNGIRCYQVEKANLRKRIVDIFGRSYNDRLVPIEETTGIVKIVGFVGKPEFAKKSRGEQFLFVNDRFFRDSYFNHAITQAYDGLLASKTFPSYFLYFYVDPAAIDVNVHPTKTEIKFEEDKEIYAILKSSVKQGLGKFNIAPALDFDQETSFDVPYSMRNQLPVQPEIQVDTQYNPFNATTFSRASSPSSGVRNDRSTAILSAGFGAVEPKKEDWEGFYKIDQVDDKPALELELHADANKQFIFQGAYLFCTTKNGLLAIHGRRAKERIVYDEIMQTFVMQPISSQQLLFPFGFELSAAEKMLWEENKVSLNRLGFAWSLSDTGMDIEGAPAHLKDEGIQNSVQDIITSLSVAGLDKGEVAHVLISAISKAAANQSMQWNGESANQLLNSLFQCPEHQYSPTGKVILNTLQIKDINQLF